MDDQPYQDQPHKIDRLLDAVELVKADRRQEALPILRALIREDSDFEEAWLWMSLAVDEMDQSVICLDNVLRINPDNVRAATALYHLQQAESAAERKRSHLRRYRDLALIGLWLLTAMILFSVFVSLSNQAALLELTATP
ncbi:MAG: hypothetical protein ACFE0Q_07005 [Anaerolineae bacterium]